MEELTARQNELLENINRIKVNFSKDPSTRKTSDYIKKRIEALDSLWGEFEFNHSKIMNQPDLAPTYISSNMYTQGKDFYQATRILLSSYGKEEKSTQPSGEVDDLLALQRTHFRGLNRQISNINICEISDKWELEDELRSVQSKWNTIENLHLQIDHILQGGDLTYDDEYTQHETAYKSFKRLLNNKISSMIHLQQSTPQLEIPTFTGRYSQWPTFFDLFSETIHANNSITKAQKMQHLKSKVKGEAERLIQHLHISAENYDAAWEILVHRYNNPQALFTHQIEIFLNQPNIIQQSSSQLKRLYDTTTECIHGIHSLGVDTSSWDPLLVHLLCKKLDTQTYSDYKEARKSPRELPTLDEFLNFIECKFVALEPIVHQTGKSFTHQPLNKNFKQSLNNSYSNIKPNYNKNKKQFQSRVTYTVNCPLCNLRHALFICRKFKNMTPADRLATVNKYNFCRNCLRNHNESECVSTKRCKDCQGNHNSLLHDAYIQPLPLSSPLNGYNSSITQGTSQNTHNINHVASDSEEILLTTVTLNVLSSNGNYVTLRALLDQGSQISLISENATQILGLQRRSYNASISGIGPISKQSKGIVSLECQSIYGDYQFHTQALVVSSVISNLPNSSFKKKLWPHLQNLPLADPSYNVSSRIDLLLDASVYSEILMSGLVKGPPKAPIAQQTKLGWILSGNVMKFNCFAVLNNLDGISKFWEIEDIGQSSSMTIDEQFCEEYYQNTTRRLESGRYEVGLPMKPGYEFEIGSSRPKAIAQFLKLEKQMSKNPIYCQKYKHFISDYETLGHMQLVSDPSNRSVILPHHGVWKMNSTTTQLRVVFNASSKTSSGKSLNDLMYSGPNLQKNLMSLILNWRRYKFVLTADVEKMFRMIMVRKTDRHLQSIIWRDSSDESFYTYQLATITYGTKAAPFLAMRTLQQLAMDDAEKYPLASCAVNSSFYMDDLLTGENSLSKAKELLFQLTSMFQGAGMNLRKWSSNEPQILQDLEHDQLNSPYEFKCTETRKTLGLTWIPSSDSFAFSNQIQFNNKPVTKRQLLSQISQLFDPLGWLSPLIIKAKLLFQRAWSSGVEWDDELSEIIQNDWLIFKEDIHNIHKFTISRYIGNIEIQHQFHAFCDASDKAYACAIYLVSKQDKGDYTSRLVVAKTKLAPLSKKLSLPRLELCGALLLSQLVEKVQKTFCLTDMSIHAWTDSMVVLGWLRGDISRWKTFVANRVQRICEIIPPSYWHHVRSEENAADCATRGVSAQQLLDSSLWWEGPSWLINFDPANIKQESYKFPTIEIKTRVHAALDKNKFSFIIELLEQHSSLVSVARIVSWISRFILRIRNKSSSREKVLTSCELNAAYDLIAKHVQYQDFYNEIESIRKTGRVHSGSKICNLNPYMDEHGLLRVGGRLENADLCSSAKHPIILSNHSRLTNLVIDQAHLITLHGGPRLTLAYIRDRYWIISGMRTVKRQLRMCVKCRRYSHDKLQPIMADLPQARVTPSRPFTHSGVDFTGHVELKANKGRGIKTVKGYVAVFVCLSTKAIHLELVSDLGTSAFIAAFRRFCARRGTPSHVYSDNGTNFVGANRVLKKEYREILDSINSSDFLKSISDQNIHWHFNAPAWPSAGGLWEAAVKSLKYHLRRVLGDQKLTYEEFSTLLCQVEACLNSRPLCQLSEDPEDGFLTPGHFLIGGPLLSRPHTEQHSLTYHSRWQLVQAMMKNFWSRWSSEYLQQLQARNKWRKPSQNVEINNIVLIKEENQPPGKWALGRIQDLHPGRDGQVRVVTIKTSKNIIQRPVNKLVLLPVCTLPSTQHSSPLSTDVSNVNNQNGTRPRRNATRKSFFLSLMLLFCFITGTLQQQLKPFNITPITTNQGFYFDKISDLQLIKDDWKLVIYYNMSTYWQSVSEIYNYIEHLEETSKQMGSQYRSVVLQLRHELQEIEHYNDILKHQTMKRNRRGLINGVGYIASTLFGVLDERFAEKYNQDIERIAKNENHIQNLLRNQTSVLEAEYNILRRNEEVMNKQFTFIHQHLRNISLKLNEVVLDNKNAQYLTSSALAATIIISNLRRIQQTLIDTITDIAHGRVNVHILSPEQLEQQINVISGQLRGDLEIPVERSSLADLYQIMKSSARVYDKYLIIEIKIPLLNSDIFELDGIISIPQRKDDTHLYFVSTSPYIAYNFQKDIALLLSDYDLKMCVHITSNQKILCSLDKPIYNLKMKPSLCHLKPISKEAICSQNVIVCRDQWFTLHSRNSWFYSCCGECRLRVLCSSETVMITPKGNGIIHLAQDCTLKSDYYSLYAHNNFLNYVNVKPNIEVPEISILNSFVNTSAFDDFKDSQIDHGFMWNHLKDQITGLKEQSATVLRIHDVHHYTISYIVVTVLVVTGGILACKYIKRKYPSFCTRHRASVACARPVEAEGRRRGSPGSSAPESSEVYTVKFVNKETSTSPIVPKREFSAV